MVQGPGSRVQGEMPKEAIAELCSSTSEPSAYPPHALRPAPMAPHPWPLTMAPHPWPLTHGHPWPAPMAPQVPKEAIDELFDQWDKDGGGALSYPELNKILRARPAGKAAAVAALGKIKAVGAAAGAPAGA